MFLPELTFWYFGRSFFHQLLVFPSLAFKPDLALAQEEEQKCKDCQHAEGGAQKISYQSLTHAEDYVGEIPSQYPLPKT